MLLELLYYYSYFKNNRINITAIISIFLNIILLSLINKTSNFSPE